MKTLLDKKTLIAVILAAASISAAFWVYGRESSYDDCILKNMPNAQNNAAASSIAAACKRKHAQNGGYVSFE